MANLQINANHSKRLVTLSFINAGARPGTRHSVRKVTYSQSLRRKPLTENPPALASYQPRVKSKVDLLIAQLAQREGEPANTSAWSMFFAFDVMGDLAFGKDFHMLEKGQEDDALLGIHNSMDAFGYMHHVIWLLHFMITIPGLGGAFNKFRDWCEGQVVEKQQVCICVDRCICVKR